MVALNKNTQAQTEQHPTTPTFVTESYIYIIYIYMTQLYINKNNKRSSVTSVLSESICTGADSQKVFVPVQTALRSESVNHFLCFHLFLGEWTPRIH